MKDYDIHKRIFEFVVSVVKFLNKLPKTQSNLIFINQCIHSVTSMGANDQEADGALTKMDFIHCYSIVRKEGKETVFWLMLITEINLQTRPYTEKLTEEGNELVAIVSTIIKNASINSKLRK